MLNPSEILSLIAIVVSVASFGVAAYTAYQDRSRLRITSVFSAASQYGPARITITLVNMGRRPVILRLLGGTDAAGNWSGTYFKYGTSGLRLGEHERHERSLINDDAVDFGPEGDPVVYGKLWVEDSLGIRHQVPNSKIHLQRLLGKAAV